MNAVHDLNFSVLQSFVFVGILFAKRKNFQKMGVIYFFAERFTSPGNCSVHALFAKPIHFLFFFTNT